MQFFQEILRGKTHSPVQAFHGFCTSRGCLDGPDECRRGEKRSIVRIPIIFQPEKQQQKIVSTPKIPQTE